MIKKFTKKNNMKSISEKKFNNNKFLLFNVILTLLGFSFLVYYVFRASENVVSSDYIRICYFYLPNVHDLHYLFSSEGLARVPFTFLARIINVDFFKYNVFFDRILGIFGLALMNFAILKYVDKFLKDNKIKTLAYIIISYVIFSLSDWEMILNGTGYVHFLSIAIISFAFLYYEENDKIAIILLIIASLIFGGQYGVSFDVLFIFISTILIIIKYLKSKKIVEKNFLELKDKEYRTNIIYIIVASICLILYMISYNSSPDIVTVGAHDVTLMEVIKEDILFPVRFLIKALASSIVGVETFTYAISFETITEKMIYLVGVLYLIILIFALCIFIYFIINNKFYIVPFMFVMMGTMNYALVFLARFNFLRDEYGMSSRYQLQYMLLLIGVLLYLFKFVESIDFKNLKNRIKNIFKVVLVTMSLFIIVYGRLLTNLDEIFKADFRNIIYNNLINVAKNYEEYSDEDLMNSFEYHRDVEHIKYTLEMLKDNKLNVFSD